MVTLGIDGVEAFWSYHSEEIAKYFLESAVTTIFFTHVEATIIQRLSHP